MLTKIKHKITNIDKHIFIRNFLFILAVTVIYSLSVNIPLINMQYPEKYFILAFAVSIFRDYIIWFTAFLNRWVFAVFTFITFTAGLGLRYMNKYLSMDLSTGNFEVILATNFNEAKGIINTVLITHFIIGILLALICIYLRFKLSQKRLPHTNTSKNGGGHGFYLLYQ